MQHARPNRLRRAVVYASLATLLGVVALTLSQCTLVGDKLTGVGLSMERPTDCFHLCKYNEHIQVKALQKQLRADILACGSDQACIDALVAAYEAELIRLRAVRTACRAACHRSGDGSAG
jgi:hypothetical protein